MPTRLRSPCRWPSCPGLAAHHGYCEQHRHLARQSEKRYDEQRGSSAQRGYDYRWQQLRAYKLRVNPLCEDCEAEHRVVAATMVHHADPISEGGAALPPLEELVSLCQTCHDRRHKAS